MSVESSGEAEKFTDDIIHTRRAHFVCPACGGSGRIRNSESASFGKCTTCLTTLSTGTRTITVQGANHDEVLTVMSALNERELQEAASRKLNNPWMAGSFYLAAGVVLLAVLFTATSLVPGWIIPLAVASALLLLSIIGAFQLRNDDRLSERNFVRLMSTALLRLPALLRQGRSPDNR